MSTGFCSLFFILSRMRRCSWARPPGPRIAILIFSLAPFTAADGRMGKGPGGHHRTGRGARRLDETPTAHLAIVSHRIRLQELWKQDHGHLECIRVGGTTAQRHPAAPTPDSLFDPHAATRLKPAFPPTAAQTTVLSIKADTSPHVNSAGSHRSRRCRPTFFRRNVSPERTLSSSPLVERSICVRH